MQCEICVVKVPSQAELDLHLTSADHIKNALLEETNARYRELKSAVLEAARAVALAPRGLGFVEQTTVLQNEMKEIRESHRHLGRDAMKAAVTARLEKADASLKSSEPREATALSIAIDKYIATLGALEQYGQESNIKIPWRVRYAADLSQSDDDKVTFEGGVIVDAQGKVIWTTVCEECGYLIQRGCVGIGVQRYVCLDCHDPPAFRCIECGLGIHKDHRTVIETDDNVWLHVKALDSGSTVPEILLGSLDTYGPRPAIGSLHDSPHKLVTYAELKTMILNTASHLVTHCPRPAIIGISSQNRLEYMVVDMASAVRHTITIGLHTTYTQEEVEDVIQHAGINHIFHDQQQQERYDLVKQKYPHIMMYCMDGVLQDWMKTSNPEVRGEDVVIKGPWDSGLEEHKKDIFTVIYTSGSSGRPKGVAIPEAGFRYDISHPLKIFPLVCVSFIPLSHSTDRMRVWECMWNGGRVYMTHYGHQNWSDHELHAGAERFQKLKDASIQLQDNGTMEMLEDIALVHPTIFIAPPRIWKGLEVLARHFGLPFVQDKFGKRVMAIATGGGPTSDTTFEFVQKLFPNLTLLESYGATEIGGIAIERNSETKQMHVLDDVEVILKEIPELNITRPRGEAWIRTKVKGMRTFYWNNPIDSAAAYQTYNGETWFVSGDICEGTWSEDGTNKITDVRVVERKKNFTRLSSGYVLLPETLESILEKCACVQHVCVLPTGKSEGYAVVLNLTTSTTSTTLETQCSEEINKVLAEAGITEKPVRVIIDNDVWQSNTSRRQVGMLTVSLKPNRRVIAEKFKDELK